MMYGMSKSASLGMKDRPSVETLERRAKAILKARPAYKEMVDFYLTVFRKQLEWRDRLTVRPEAVTPEQVRDCLSGGAPLAESYDPGIAKESLVEFWREMKSVFGRGNETLQAAVTQIDGAEQAGEFKPGAWLLRQRPDCPELLSDTARELGVAEPILASLTRAVVFPHWQVVAESWLPDDRLDYWRKFRCPVCGGAPELAETCTEASTSECVSAAVRRLMHCAFCSARWAVPVLECPSCGSAQSGDAKYLFTSDEPELRIDFCKGCSHYVKVVDGDKVGGRIYVGLELLAAAHLDMIAQEKNLSPLQVCA